MNTAHNRETYPLTPLQVGMLFHALANMGSGVDVEQIICSIHEPLHIEAFQRAWSRIVERHAVLRSQFEWEEITEPRQVVIPGASFKGECFDWKHLSKLDQERQLDKFIQEDRAQGFNLARMPLMRLAIFELGNEEYKFIWTFHHILLDGRAFPLILEEVFSFYEAFVENRDIEMDGPRPFRDYVLWVGERDLAKDERFWRENLAGFTSPTPLVVGTSLAAGKRNMGSEGVVESRMPEPLTSALRHLASSHGLSMNTFVEGAWALLLSRYNHEDDILYGTTRSCRRASVEGAESMIGLLINTVPVRVRILQQTKMIDWLKQLREQHSQMREYIHSPLYEIQRWSGMTHGSPLFESLVVFENYYLDSFMRSKGGRWVNREFEYRGRTNYPLTLIGYDDDELILRIEFDEERFSQDTVKRILGHLQTILQSMPGNLDNRVADIPILTEAERHQLLVQWNPSQVHYPVDGCLHELFEKQVKRSPDALAMVFENQQLTYRELNRRANQLAHYLRKLGVGPDVLVGLFMERSVEMVIAILGILKAGGAYVPLDPIYPKDRLSFMLEDMQASVIVAQQALAASLPSNSAKIIYFEALEAKSEFHDADAYENPVSGVKADNLAYVIYTSGSTGKPKGVLITHANVMRLFAATDSWFHIGQEDVWTMFHSYAFDFSVWELWGPLLYGGRLVVVSYEVSRSPKAFYELLKKEGVTVLNQTPSAFKQLIDAEESLGNEDGLSLRLIIFGGEALELNSLKPWVKRHGDKKPQLINMYGITETTVHVTYRPITIEDIERGRGSVIGIPIPDLQVYVLDRYLQPVPIGVSGEMYVGGTGLARGYLNRPELTNERFVPNPFSNTKGGRLYKSGDLARYLPDQDLEYLGRIDHQVKIRGFRVELGEIESVLGGHEDVREVMVMAREDVPGDKRLVAYIVPEGEQTPSVSVLRQYLKEKLPEYMVPNAFVMLEKFLLTPNGKIDRRALPAPEHTRPELEAGYVAPQTPVEQSLAEIWANVLGLERVGVNDNFFELGGHSLLAVQLFVRIRKWAGVDLPLATLFGSPTVRALAEHLDYPSGAAIPISGETMQEASSPVQQWRSLVPMQPEGNRPPFFIIHAIGGNVLNYRPLLRHLGPDQPFYGLQARGLDGVLSPNSSMEEMAGHYIAEIRTVQSSGPYFLGGASFGGTVAFEIAQQLTKQGEKVALLVLFDTIGPGSRGYRHWRTSLRNRLFRERGAEPVQQIPLPVYLSKRILRYLSNRMGIVKCGFFRLTNRPIPLKLRLTYLLRYHNKALIDYIPLSYLGPITLFRGPAGNDWPFNDPELGWKDIARGDLKIITIDAPHLEFMEPPELGVQFAEHLSAAQDKVQGAPEIFDRFPKNEAMGVNNSEEERIRVSH